MLLRSWREYTWIVTISPASNYQHNGVPHDLLYPSPTFTAPPSVRATGRNRQGVLGREPASASADWMMMMTGNSAGVLCSPRKAMASAWDAGKAWICTCEYACLISTAGVLGEGK